MWRQSGRVKNHRPAEVLKQMVSKDFQKTWGLTALGVTENLIKCALAYVGGDFSFLHNESD